MCDIVGHGNVRSFCDEHGLILTGSYDGSLSGYKGDEGTVLVSNEPCALFEFYWQKLRLGRMGIILISARDRGEMGMILENFVNYVLTKEQRKGRVGGRQPYGFKWEDGRRTPVTEEIELAKRVIEWKESGWSFRKIEQESGLNISTIQSIWKNRDIYM